MKKIRLDRIYLYYYETAKSMLEELNALRDNYVRGEISYKRAWTRMDSLIRQINWRCEVCFGVAACNRKQTGAWDVLTTVHNFIQWMAA